MSHVSYLEAKRHLDDRSLNRDVVSAFAAALPPEPTILEIGCGTATMPERLFEWGVVDSGRWIAMDAHAGAIAAGRERLSDRADTNVDGDLVRLDGFTIELETADAFEYVARTAERFDAVVGGAFFDVVDARRAVRALASVTELLYAPITYDGQTMFKPKAPDDDAVLRRYTRHMRECRPGAPDGATTLSATLSEIYAVGPSTWRVDPPYGSGERTVVEHVVETIERAVDHVGYDAREWAEHRRRQLEDETLRYTATNRDVLGRP